MSFFGIVLGLLGLLVLYVALGWVGVLVPLVAAVACTVYVTWARGRT